MGNVQSSDNTQITNIESIVNDLLNGKLKKPRYTNYTSQIQNISNELIDYSREYKDLCTDIIVKTFLSEEKGMYNFLQLVYGTFNTAIQVYIKAKNLNKMDIFFVYKGGNILRIISNDFLREFPRSASKIITDYYDRFFKRSDADFSIYIDPKIENYDKIFDDMTYLSYLLQVYIRKIFSENITDYFELFKFNQNYKKHVLTEYFDRASKANALNDPNNNIFYQCVLKKFIFLDTQIGNGENERYIGKSDLAQEITDDNKSATFNLDKIYHSMFIQMNQTLDFNSSSGRIKFNLIRTKVCFNFIFEKPDGQKMTKIIGGELIDVSIPHRLDDNFRHFYDNNGPENLLQVYRLNYGNSILEFLSYKYYYLAHDLEFILFKFVKKPWQTPKYEKRINRLFYLYVIDLFIKLDTMKERKNLILDLLNGIFKINLTVSTLLDNGKQILDSVEYFIDKYSKKDLLIIVLLENIKNIVLNELVNENDLEEYNKMSSILIENANIMNQAFKGVKNYCSEDANLNAELLYNNDFKSLIGGKKP
jgi:hypothetical protein